MTNEELRRACERAGMLVEPWIREGDWGVRFTHEGRQYSINKSDPMLPSYVADRLMWMVAALDSLEVEVWPKADSCGIELRCTIWSGRKGCSSATGTATVEEGATVAIIRACMEVLPDETP